MAVTKISVQQISDELFKLVGRNYLFIDKENITLDLKENTLTIDKVLNAELQTPNWKEVSKSAIAFIRDAETDAILSVARIKSSDESKNEIKIVADRAASDILAKLEEHIADKENPHQVTKAQVGLGNVDDTSDEDKPISKATQKALDDINKNATSLEARVSTNETNIETNRTNIETNKENIEANKQSIDALDTRVTKNEGDIATNKQSITDLEAKHDADKKELEDKIEANKSEADTKIEANATAIENLEAKHDTDKAELEEKISKNAEDIATNKANIQTNADNIAENSEEIDTNRKNIAVNTLDIEQNKQTLIKHQEEIDTLKDRADTNDETVKALEGRVDVNQSDIQTNKDNIQNNFNAIEEAKQRLDKAEGDIQTNTQSIMEAQGNISKNTEDIEKRVTKEEAKTFVKDIQYDAPSCTFTFTMFDDSTQTVDLPLESTVKSGYYDKDSEELVLVLVNEEEIRIPAKDLIDIYTGGETDTIRVEVSAENVITAIVKTSSVTMELLGTDVIQRFTDIEAKNAEQDNEIQNLHNKDGEIDLEIQEIKDKNDEQDERLETAEGRLDTHDTQIGDVDTKTETYKRELEEKIGNEVSQLNQSITDKEASINARIDTEVQTLNTTIEEKEQALNKSISDTEETLDTKIEETKAEIESKVEETQTDLTNQIVQAKSELNETMQNDKAELEGKINKNAENIQTNANNISTNALDIDNLEGRMDTAEGDINSLEERMNTAEENINTNTENIATNKSNIEKNKGDIEKNKNDIAQQSTQIALNAANIATNKQDISHLTTRMTSAEEAAEALTERVSTNETNIAQNTTDIERNKGLIDTNTESIEEINGKITQNTTGIESNETAINKNKTDIAKLRTDVDTNTTNIEQNTADILQNKSDIATNKTDIKNNKDSIIQNSANIAINATSIATNTRDIASNKSEIDALKKERDSLEHFRGYYAKDEEIKALEGHRGDYAYSAESHVKWVYDVDSTSWAKTESKVPDQITPKSNTIPAMDGNASAGTEQSYASGDHVHPHDTTKVDVTTFEAHTGNKTNPHQVTKAQVGLGNVDNTSDANKPISTATQTKFTKIEGDITSATARITVLESQTGTIEEDIESINTTLSGKAPNNHASTATTYGLGTTANYGHVKTINNLTTSTNNNGEALSAYQGYLLQSNKAPNNHASTATTYGLGTSSNYGHTKVINNLTTSSHADGAALSAHQGKVLDDKITTLTNNTVPKAGGTFTGNVTFAGNTAFNGSASVVGTLNVNNNIRIYDDENGNEHTLNFGDSDYVYIAERDAFSVKQNDSPDDIMEIHSRYGIDFSYDASDVYGTSHVKDGKRQGLRINGKPLIVDDLTSVTSKQTQDIQALSAYQGYVLNNKIATLQTSMSKITDIPADWNWSNAETVVDWGYDLYQKCGHSTSSLASRPIMFEYNTTGGSKNSFIFTEMNCYLYWYVGSPAYDGDVTEIPYGPTQDAIIYMFEDGVLKPGEECMGIPDSNAKNLIGVRTKNYVTSGHRVQFIICMAYAW